MDNLPANKTPAVRTWAAAHNVELCLTPTNASWANPIEAQFGPLRTFTMGACDHPNHPALARRLQAYLRWRNTYARHPDVLAAQTRERARIRSERRQRWGPAPTPSSRGPGGFESATPDTRFRRAAARARWPTPPGSPDRFTLVRPGDVITAAARAAANPLLQGRVVRVRA
jgi:hypothetical protein